MAFVTKSDLLYRKGSFSMQNLKNLSLYRPSCLNNNDFKSLRALTKLYTGVQNKTRPMQFIPSFWYLRYCYGKSTGSKVCMFRTDCLLGNSELLFAFEHAIVRTLIFCWACPYFSYTTFKTSTRKFASDTTPFNGRVEGNGRRTWLFFSNLDTLEQNGRGLPFQHLSVVTIGELKAKNRWAMITQNRWCFKYLMRQRKTLS